jgi:hypothetical protein
MLKMNEMMKREIITSSPLGGVFVGIWQTASLDFLDILNVSILIAPPSSGLLLAFDLIHHQYPVALQNQNVQNCSQKVLQEHNTPVAHLHRLDSKFNKGSYPLRKGHEKGTYVISEERGAVQCNSCGRQQAFSLHCKESVCTKLCSSPPSHALDNCTVC